jgi:hypothetical protein
LLRACCLFQRNHLDHLHMISRSEHLRSFASLNLLPFLFLKPPCAC